MITDRLLVKIQSSTERLMPEAVRETPYEEAKDILLVNNVDDREFMTILFEAMYPELPERKGKQEATV